MKNASQFIQQSPFGQWAIEKSQRNAASIAQRAQGLGLILGESAAINNEMFTLSLFNQTLRTGSLNVLSWFLDKYELDRSFRR